IVETRRLATAYPKRKVGGEACRVAPDRLIQGARFDAVQTGETRRQDHPLAAQRDDHTFDRCEPPAQRARAHQGCWEGRVNAESTKPVAGVAPAPPARARRSPWRGAGCGSRYSKRKAGRPNTRVAATAA